MKHLHTYESFLNEAKTNSIGNIMLDGEKTVGDLYDLLQKYHAKAFNVFFYNKEDKPGILWIEEPSVRDGWIYKDYQKAGDSGKMLDASGSKGDSITLYWEEGPYEIKISDIEEIRAIK